jgi:hypothetical protein
VHRTRNVIVVPPAVLDSQYILPPSCSRRLRRFARPWLAPFSFRRIKSDAIITERTISALLSTRKPSTTLASAGVSHHVRERLPHAKGQLMPDFRSERQRREALWKIQPAL